MARKHPAPPNPFLMGSAAPSVPLTLPVAVLSQTSTVPVKTSQPTPTGTETAPAGDIVAQAMEQIITPEERQQLAGPTPEELGQLEQEAMQHASVLMQGVVPTSRQHPEIRTEAQVHTVQIQPTETDMEMYNLLQGEIAPLLTIKEQQK